MIQQVRMMFVQCDMGHNYLIPTYLKEEFIKLDESDDEEDIEKMHVIFGKFACGDPSDYSFLDPQLVGYEK